MTDSNGTNMYMPVAPAYGYNMVGNNGGIFGNGGDLWGFLLVLLLCGNGMWGGLGGFGGGMMWPMMMGGMGGGFGLDYLYPWLNNSEHISAGFRDQQIQDSLNGIQNGITTGFSGVQQSLCSGFAGVNATVTGAQNAIAQQLYGNEIASLNRSFAEQTANAQGFNGTQAGIADLKYTVATENCADRAALASGIRDVMENCNRNNQAILDKLCTLELDGVKSQLAAAQRENLGLQNQLNMANLAASQTAQDSRIIDGVYNRLSQCPVDTTPVFGRQPIFTCNGGIPNCGCGAA